jgi:hypothetical protein
MRLKAMSGLSQRSQARRLLLLSLASVASVGVLVTQISSGYSLFTAEPKVINVPVTVAQASLAIGSGTATTIGIPITNLVPGQTQTRAITLNNTGSVNFGSLALRVTGGSGVLVSSGALELGVSLCSSTPVGLASGDVSCTSTPVLPATPVKDLLTESAISLTSSTQSGVTCSWNACSPGKGSTMLISVTLASSAPSTVYGASTSIDFSFTGEGIS